MTEDEAIGWTRERFGAEATERLGVFREMVASENERQNLVSPSTIASLWSRHIVDSLQLVALAPSAGTWLDIGTGGGFPGLAVAIVRHAPMILVEPRRKRATFLEECAARLGLGHVEVRAEKVERVEAEAAVISARAVASIENLLRAAAHCATPETRWLLPRGAVDTAEIAKALRGSKWMFHVEQSLTSNDSAIVILAAR